MVNFHRLKPRFSGFSGVCKAGKGSYARILPVFRKVGKAIGVILLCLAVPAFVQAQAAVQIALSSPDTSEFPHITAYLDARNAQGDFLTGLGAGEVAMVEDGVEIPLTSIEEIRPGVQFVVAMNTSTAFAIRDSLGNRRYDYVFLSLQSWVQGLGDSLDDLSLLTTEGRLATHVQDPDEWLAALQGYVPDLRTAIPNLDVLATAINLAADPTPTAGMGRVVLFLTPNLSADSTSALQSLADFASEQRVRVIVWMIDSDELLGTIGAINLQNLARQTGGYFFSFSGAETIPELNPTLESSRRIYQLGYRSGISAAGGHQIAAVVRVQEGEFFSPTASFELALQPPSPIFVSPPAEVLLSYADEGAELQPARQTIEILVEFPDGMERSLTRTTLYANGEVVAENTVPPFDSFRVDFSRFDETQAVYLKVEAQDEVGLIGASIETPVQVVVPPAPGLLGSLARNIPLLTIAVTGAAGLVLLLVLVLAGRITPLPLGARRKARQASVDPVTQPLPLAITEVAPTPPARRIAEWARRIVMQRFRQPVRAAPAKAALAYLVRLDESGEPTKQKFRMEANEITLGSGAEANWRLEDPAVESLHARIWRDDEGVFHVADEDSTAGTWLNFAPVSRQGSRIVHGDLLNVGRTSFRFTLNGATPARKPVITRQETEP